MQSMKVRVPLLLLLGAVLAVPQAPATTLLHFDLAELTQRADKIFRGTVVDVEQGAVEAGGGTIPVVSYRLKVEEMLKGDADLVKGEVSVVEIRMVGSIKAQGPDENGLVKFSPWYDVPRLEMGSDYLLFTTPPSPIGLSTTVGLGQGAFTVFSMNKEDFAVNLYGNLGLGVGDGGPVAYSELTAKILALLGQ